MKKSLSTAPKRKDILADAYDSQYLMGNYAGIFLGHAETSTVRQAGASGGVLTAVLQSLIHKNQVDAVVSVGFSENEPLVPRFLISRNEQAMQDRAGSVYTYMRLSELVCALDKLDCSSVAVVCQPCHVPALRKLQSSRFPFVKYIFSFFCGYNMSFDATTYLITKIGIPVDQIKRIEYRGGAYPGGFHVTTLDGKCEGFGKECYEVVNLLFLRPGCEQCNLYMGENSDLALGDAWINGKKKLNIVIPRTEQGLKSLQLAVDTSAIALYKFSEKQAVLMHLHNIRYKKYGHSSLMRAFVWLLRDFLPASIVPFHFLSFLARIRRRWKIGIEVPDMTPAPRIWPVSK